MIKIAIGEQHPVRAIQTPADKWCTRTVQRALQSATQGGKCTRLRGAPCHLSFVSHTTTNPAEELADVLENHGAILIGTIEQRGLRWSDSRCPNMSVLIEASREAALATAS